MKLVFEVTKHVDIPVVNVMTSLEVQNINGGAENIGQMLSLSHNHFSSLHRPRIRKGRGNRHIEFSNLLILPRARRRGSGLCDKNKSRIHTRYRDGSVNLSIVCSSLLFLLLQ
ncbi:hypothetical protein Bca101_067772 [Brassica carinata]